MPALSSNLADLLAVEPTELPTAAVGPLSTADVAMAVLALIGVICLVSLRRSARALGPFLFAMAMTSAAIILALKYGPSSLGLLHAVSRTIAITSALWALIGCAMSGPRSADPRRPLPAPSSMFFVGSLICGIGVTALLLLALLFATWSRVLGPENSIDLLSPSRAPDLLASIIKPDHLVDGLSSAGAVDLLALLVAALFWKIAAPRSHQPAVLLVLLALLVWWSSLMIPSGVGTPELTNRPTGTTRGLILAIQPAWWTWTFQMQFGFAVVLISAAVIQEWRYRSRRGRAWPDRLDDLLEPYSRWPAYIQVEAIIAAAILIVGVYQIVQPYPTAWQPGLANSLVSLAAGFTCLFLVYRRWSGNTAGLGIALVTLAAVALACLLATAIAPLESSADYARRIPILDNAVLVALAAAIVFWSWLTHFWDQQLLNGRPWTTAGRMIPPARRAAFLLSALAALVAFHMALWPRQVLATDASAARLTAGLGGLLLLAWITGRKAKREDSTADATFSVAFIIAAMVFLFVRIAPASRREWGWLIQYEAVVLGFACLPMLVVAELLDKTRWRSYSSPLWLLALLIVPMRVLILLLPSNRLPAEWVRPMVLAMLGAMYSFAGAREHRRAILVLGGVLLLAALTTFYRSYWKMILP